MLISKDYGGKTIGWLETAKRLEGISTRYVN